ncbi:McrB family protein [Tepidibacter sp. Z1-5]|uniref:McrB family protein n=1 Tax=Tepidibacter sp. Z1-5 TaxID=3134138 RepID=UPI0030C09C7A
MINIDKKDLLMCNNTYLLGILATDIEEYPAIGETRDAVTTMKNSSNIMFYIQTISDEPDFILEKINPYIPNESLYIGIDVHQQHLDIWPYGYMNDREDVKIDIIYEKLKNKIILFRPNVSIKDGRIYKNIHIVDIISTEYGFEIDDRQYRCIPQINLNNDVFEKKLLDGSYINLGEYNHHMLPPEYAICGKYMYFNFQSWKKHESESRQWACNRNQSSIKRIEFKFDRENFPNDLVRGSNNIIFISDVYLSENIDNKLESEGEYLVDISNRYTDDAEVNNDEYDDKDEMNFLKSFKQYTIENNLCYDTDDLINFHISAKTNPLTIVAGMSGTGKTQLARAYANVLGLSEKEGSLLFLPISPSYIEPDDLIGYLNTNNGLYVAAETGLVDVLIKAENNPEEIYMIIFDEMNLSQVEHWFAPFISLLELNADDRRLKLYSENSICHNNSKYKSSIKIRDNIIFIGTVNLDETTKDFSDRLLDRANIVTLKKKSFVDFRKEKITSQEYKYEKRFYSGIDYSYWINKKKGLEAFTIAELELLDKLHDTIQKYDMQKGVSFRIMEKIGQYINNIPDDSKGVHSISRDYAFDIEIKQRLLTKIKGTERQFGELIGKFSNTSKSIIESELYDLFESEEAQKISSFTLTKEEIVRKSKELSLYGYTN